MNSRTKSGDLARRLITQTTFADALHQEWRLAESQDTFHEAEEIQKQCQPEFPLLYSLWGFRYCDLLLSQRNYIEVERRASQTLQWDEKYALAQGSTTGLLEFALDNLLLGRAQLLHFQHDPNFPISNLPTIFNRAVDGLRQAGMQDMLPLGLLARAEYYQVTRNPNKAQKDLDEAFTIATRGGMGLHIADCHLGYARLYVAKDEKSKAREHWQIAKDSIEKMGYHRRDKEVQELEEQLK